MSKIWPRISLKPIVLKEETLRSILLPKFLILVDRIKSYRIKRVEICCFSGGHLGDFDHFSGSNVLITAKL